MKHIKKFNESSSKRVFTLKDMERAFNAGIEAGKSLDGRSVTVKGKDSPQEIIKKLRSDFIKDLIKFGSVE